MASSCFAEQNTCQRRYRCRGIGFEKKLDDINIEPGGMGEIGKTMFWQCRGEKFGASANAFQNYPLISFRSPLLRNRRIVRCNPAIMAHNIKRILKMHLVVIQNTRGKETEHKLKQERGCNNTRCDNTPNAQCPLKITCGKLSFFLR